MIVIDAYGRHRMKDERRCEHCGCWTNAKLRMCCYAGYKGDGGKHLLKPEGEKEPR